MEWTWHAQFTKVKGLTKNDNAVSATVEKNFQHHHLHQHAGGAIVEYLEYFNILKFTFLSCFFIFVIFWAMIKISQFKQDKLNDKTNIIFFQETVWLPYSPGRKKLKKYFFLAGQLLDSNIVLQMIGVTGYTVNWLWVLQNTIVVWNIEIYN